MKIFPMPTKCPVEGCGSRLIVTKLECQSCQTEIRGRFAPNEFSLLPSDQLEFMRLYIKTRGNLRKVGRMLDISYPTVLARFNAMLQSLGYEDSEIEPDESVQIAQAEKDKVLSLLEKGEITAAEAAAKLTQLKRN